MSPVVSIVIPIYHDRDTILRTLERVGVFFTEAGMAGEIIVVNDGGTDGGADLVRQHAAMHPFIRLIDRAANCGKGYTVREGLAAARGTYLFFTDADLPYGTEPIRAMLARLQTGEAGLALSNRNLAAHQASVKHALLRNITHRVYAWLIHLLFGFNFTDTQAGLKGMTRELAAAVLPRLTIDRWSFDVELILAALTAGYRVTEVPVALQGGGRSNLHIGRDAPQMLREVWQIWRRHRRGQYARAKAA